MDDNDFESDSDEQLYKRIIKTMAGSYEVQYRYGFIIVGKWKFSPDLRSVIFDGKHYCDNTDSQASVLKRVFQYHEDGFPSAAQSELRTFLGDKRDEKAERKSGSKNEFGARPGPQKLSNVFKGNDLFRNLLATTNGSGSRVYFNFDWNPHATIDAPESD